mmetsp:Transcript_35626/g.101516  ORF Transcript_35626/g.101516 Transcript_35626/m.101516 type:complete len:212 (-) Transcript_35626:115-750(-)
MPICRTCSQLSAAVGANRTEPAGDCGVLDLPADDAGVPWLPAFEESQLHAVELEAALEARDGALVVVLAVLTTSGPVDCSWYSRNFFFSLTTCPRGRPSSFMPTSSIMHKVSMSSQPFRSIDSAYWPKPPSFRKATTGWLSSMIAPLCSCIFRRSTAACCVVKPRALMSESSMARSVSTSSKPLRTMRSVYICKPAAVKNAATSWSWCGSC